jgi:hypothetical protein
MTIDENEKPTIHPSPRFGFQLSKFFQKIFFEKVSFPDFYFLQTPVSQKK